MAVSCARQVEGLRRRGHVVDVCVFSLGKKEDFVLPPNSIVEGGENWFFRLSGNHGYVAQTAWRQVKTEFEDRRWNWITGFGANFPGFTATVFADWLGVKSLVLVRGNDFDRDLFDPRYGYWVNESLSRAHAIGTVSNEASEKIIRLFHRKNVRWVPNGVDFENLRLLMRDKEIGTKVRGELSGGNGSKRPVIGLFGDLKDKKGIPLWHEALRESGLTELIGFLVVGLMDEETSQIIRDPGLTPHAHIVNFCSREDLPGYYSACDFVALPSIFEGMPNVLLEAMALGKIPIVSNAGAMGEIVTEGKNGFVFPAGDWAASAGAVTRALNLSASERTIFGRKAAADVRRRFPPGKELTALERIFREKQPSPRMER